MSGSNHSALVVTTRANGQACSNSWTTSLEALYCTATCRGVGPSLGIPAASGFTLMKNLMTCRGALFFKATIKSLDVINDGSVRNTDAVLNQRLS